MTTKLQTRTLGKNGPQVPALGFGIMNMHAYYGSPMKDEDCFVLLDRAVELGATFWDTSNVYGDSEAMLGRYFSARPGVREKVFLATKFGGVFNPETGLFNIVRGDPSFVIECANASLAKLNTTYIDLYFAHRIDQNTPIEHTMRALVELKEQGKIRHIGLCEASVETLRRACAVHQVAAHQVEYSPFELSIESERTPLLEACRELGVGIVAYSPLGAGMFTGRIRSMADLPEPDARRFMPRWQPENFAQNLAIVDRFAQYATKRGVSSSQLALAWLLAQGKDVVPIPGTTRAIALKENLEALEIELSQEDLDELNTVVMAAEVAGDRYPELMMRLTYLDTVPLST